VRSDDPSLTVRDPACELRGRRPLRVVCDADGALPAGARLLSDGAAPTLILMAPGARAERAGLAGLEYATVEAGAAGRLDPEAVLACLAARECNEVLLEAGPTLAGSFLEAGLADELVVYVAPTVLGDTARPLFAWPRPLQDLAQRRRFAFHDVRSVGADLRLTLRPAEV
jgi:diaminohydroxyphosphoribosylaminopyrimidine deaminase/5-amino-6-(5-phosphoribosylamino)uracil reductase